MLLNQNFNVQSYFFSSSCNKNDSKVGGAFILNEYGQFKCFRIQLFSAKDRP